eukprot:135113_1
MEQRKISAENVKSIKGVTRITRHPLLLSLNNIFIGDFLICGHYSCLFFCLPMSVLCLFGLYHQDKRHKQWFGKESVWFKQTSVIP